MAIVHLLYRAEPHSIRFHGLLSAIVAGAQARLVKRLVRRLRAMASVRLRRAVTWAAVIAPLLLVSCSRMSEATTAPDRRVWPVRYTKVQSQMEAQTQMLSGTVRPQEHAVVAARVMGVVSQADFILGQKIRAGETLVVLRADELDARLEQARAALAQAVADYDREAALLVRGAAAAETVRVLADRRRAAEAAYREMLAYQDYTRIEAPFSGTVARKYVNAGDLALSGAPLFALEGLKNWQIEVPVPASLPLLEMGASLRVQLVAGEVMATVAEIPAASDPVSRTRLAKLNLPSPAHADSGDFVRVEWPTGGESSALTVPASAISLVGQMERVFVISSGRAQLRIVRTSGLVADGSVRIAAGLDEGETVVLAPPAAMHDGDAVELRP